FQEVGGDLEVLLGRHRDAGEVDHPDQVTMVHERVGVVVGRHLGSALPIGVDDAGQLDVPELGVGQEVVLAHVSGAHDSGAQLSIVGGRSYGHHTVSLSGR